MRIVPLVGRWENLNLNRQIQHAILRLEPLCIIEDVTTLYNPIAN